MKEFIMTKHSLIFLILSFSMIQLISTEDTDTSARKSKFLFDIFERTEDKKMTLSLLPNRSKVFREKTDITPNGIISSLKYS